MGATKYLCSAKRRCIVYVVMVCVSRDHESWQGVASLRDATRKGVEQLTRKSFSIRFSRALPILLILCDSCECPSRSDGPPVGWPCSERIACRGVRRSVDAGANTYTSIYALCADAGSLPYPCINRPLHPLRIAPSLRNPFTAIRGIWYNCNRKSREVLWGTTFFRGGITLSARCFRRSCARRWRRRARSPDRPFSK